MPIFDFTHLKHRLAWAFPDDPILGHLDLATRPPPMPIVVGVRGSRTMILSRLLGAHPSLAMPTETGFLPSILDRPPSAGPLTVLEVHRLLTSARGWPDLAVDARAYLEALTPLHPFSVSDGLRACYRLAAEARGKTRWGDSVTDDLERLREIAYILPEAHVIHVVSDGRDVAHPGQGMTSAPGQDMTAVARDWNEWIRSARQQAERNLHYLEIRYEDLIADPERTLREVCAFVDLPFDPGMLPAGE
jgi:hypothetical protein